jgi:hypothetical protein
MLEVREAEDHQLLMSLVAEVRNLIEHVREERSVDVAVMDVKDGIVPLHAQIEIANAGGKLLVDRELLGLAEDRKVLEVHPGIVAAGNEELLERTAAEVREAVAHPIRAIGDERRGIPEPHAILALRNAHGDLSRGRDGGMLSVVEVHPRLPRHGLRRGIQTAALLDESVAGIGEGRGVVDRDDEAVVRQRHTRPDTLVRRELQPVAPVDQTQVGAQFSDAAAQLVSPFVEPLPHGDDVAVVVHRHFGMFAGAE